MAVIDLGEVGKEKLNELATKGVLTGLLVEYTGRVKARTEFGGSFHKYTFVVTSRSDRTRTHDVSLWLSDGDLKWYATCDADAGDEDACKANRAGGKCCSHIAVAVAEFKNKVEAAKAAKVGPGFTGKLRQVKLESIEPYVESEVLWEKEAALKKDERDIFG